MDEGPALSPRERKILADIEHDLSADERALRPWSGPRAMVRLPLAAAVIYTLAALLVCWWLPSRPPRRC
ncbi:hypothetical protein ADL00_07100 [Streptomyces sp. AS58]|uniref:hypothetical protein n=1 Tax=Streptomyces sp. AS58 TaxID=1519489 RepID=UPI0006AF41D0|nr:hypothetical protein [Streptomyces sp. AS58]KOV71809.1 hypothetical protein ADL00_07100 [Streptomyces sp. AS58]